MFSSAVLAVTPSSRLSSAVLAVTPSRMFSSLADAVSPTPSIVIGEVNTGLLEFALLFTATAMLSNSTSNSEPLMILSESPDGNESLDAKSVLLV